MAHHFGFQLGEHIKASGVELYAFKISSYPSENIVRLEGYSLKKNGKPAKAGTYVEVQESAKIEKLKGALTECELDTLLFPGTARLTNVRSFIQTAIGKSHKQDAPLE